MKIIYLTLFTVLLTGLAEAEELLRPVSFSAASNAGTLQAGEISGDDTLRVDAEPGQAMQRLIEISDPGITSPVYALKGMIRYEGIEGEGYLQMDNHFGDMGTFFSKTLASAGPLGKLSGTSEWRPFVLPFYANSGDQANASAPTPQKLSLSLYLENSGTVYLRDVGLYEYVDGEDPMSAGLWISPRAMGLVGSIGGGLIGLWGALIGFLAARGKARGFVFGSANVLIVVGIVCFGAGLVALAAGQAYAIYYPLLILGVLLFVVVGSIRKALPQRYEAVELKKIRAMDA